MTSEVVRELFRNLEHVLHDRLKVIEDILQTTRQTTAAGDSTGVLARIHELESQYRALDDYAMGQVRTLAYNHDMLEKRVESMEHAMKSAILSFQTINETIDMMQKRHGISEVETKTDDGKPVEAAEVEAEIEETEEAALNLQEDASEVEQKATASLTKLVQALDEEEEEEEVEEEVEEEEEEVEEEEEEELDIEEFVYRKRTWWRDQHNNVYTPNEEGAVDPNAVVGVWNSVTKKIEAVA